MRYSKNLERATKRKTSTQTWTDEQFREAREQDLSEQMSGAWTVVVAALASLVLAASLTTAKLVDIAERQPIGAWRDRQLTAAEGVDRAANFLSLNRPYDLIQTIRGTGESAGQRIDTIDDVISSTTTLGQPATTTSAGVAVPNTTIVTTTTTISPFPIRLVTESEPLRVFAAGDSQVEFLGQALSTEGGTRALSVDVQFRISTGLARPDYFNWPAELAAVMEFSDPEAIVLFMGANDHQDMVGLDGDRLVRDSPEWQAEWTRRLEITFDLIESDGRHLFWVLQPPMRDSRLQEAMGLLNDLATTAGASRDSVTIVDIWEMFGGNSGFSSKVEGPDGERVTARVSDGVHLNRTASSWVASIIFGEFDEVWQFAP